MLLPRDQHKGWESRGQTPCSKMARDFQLSSGTCLLTALPPPAYLALDLVRSLQLLVQLTELAEGEKMFSP